MEGDVSIGVCVSGATDSLGAIGVTDVSGVIGVIPGVGILSDGEVVVTLGLGTVTFGIAETPGLAVVSGASVISP